MDIYTYELNGNLYINLTNLCSNDCDFCVRNHMKDYDGYKLWLSREPDFEDVVNSAGDISKYDEVVFCGFGEPFYKLELMVKLAKYFKSKGKKTRVNTNGQGNLINKKNCETMLKGAIDIVSISLNSDNAKDYDCLCHSVYKEEAFNALLDFAKGCKKQGIETRLTVVDTIGEEKINKCKEIANEVGVPLKVRKYIK